MSEHPRADDHEPIHGPRLVLRPATEADVADIVRWRSDSGVLEFYSEPLRSIEEAREHYLEPDPDQPVWRLVIEEDGRGVGVIQYAHPYTGEEYSWTVGIDIFIGEPDARDRGLGTEAVRTLLAYLFEVKCLHRVTIDPEVGNLRAIRCYERAGFRRDGILRHHARERGVYVDTQWMSVLEDEWPEAKARWDAERRGGSSV